MNSVLLHLKKKNKRNTQNKKINKEIGFYVNYKNLGKSLGGFEVLIVLLQLCSQHLSNEQNVGQHYKAVCKALVAEAEELLTFLNRISSGKKQLEKVAKDEDQSRLDELQRSDWVRKPLVQL